ncbi:MAG: hypothetical protein KOO62_05170 [candidate division Zixibacteria bacterium]|nr:hypothetical protein [candidate division Zixibacteria bacterium]
MLALIVASWLAAAPVYPLNPAEQDTVNAMNLHLTLGASTGNRLVSPGPNFTVRYEWLFHHPFVLQLGVDYCYGEMKSNLYPRGYFHGVSYSVEAFYYRGTSKLIGCAGFGLILSRSYVGLLPSVADSLRRTENIVDVDMAAKIGYRLTFGLRWKRVYTLELGITEVRPSQVSTARYSATRFSVEKEKIRMNDFRLTIGYLLPLKM